MPAEHTRFHHPQEAYARVERIGKYQIQRVLGRGGMGTVYEAIDPLINRKVALKTMLAGFAETAELRTRFLREAQAAGGLRHRNIVTVYDLGEDKGTPFIAMEFIEGMDLEKIVQNREPHSMEWKLDILRQVCDGLAYAHRAGIVHRDIKPANIRVTPEGEVKIMDFGIAHLQSSTMTKSGLVMGTVHYMAPEQIEGAKLDHRADIFAVGAIAYELIAYKRPFDGETITSVMYKIMHDRPDLGALPKTDYSPDLEQIVMKALQRVPADRYQTLDEMRTELEHLVQQKADAKVRGTQAPVRRENGPATSASGLSEEQRKNVEHQMGEMRTEVERARADGQLQKALSLSRKMVETSPGDAVAMGLVKEIESEIQDREVEQLCGLALSYAADGDMELALKIAGRIERLAPASPRFKQLKTYLDEESGRRAAEALTGSAQEHLALGNLEEALAAAEEALEIHPKHALAREIRERASNVLQTRQAAERQREHEREEPVEEIAATEVMSIPDLEAYVPPPPPPPPAAPRKETAPAAAPKPAPAAPASHPAPKPQPAAADQPGRRQTLPQRRHRQESGWLVTFSGAPSGAILHRDVRLRGRLGGLPFRVSACPAA
jgi:serine/threonine protein kinase